MPLDEAKGKGAMALFEDKYDDLARFLYQQEYLYKRNYLTYPEMRNNIANGFRKTFFSEKAPLYYKNGDVYLHTLKIAIQAIGRICRCRSKNKDIYVLADRELIWNVQEACKTQCPEMKALVRCEPNKKLMEYLLKEYSRTITYTILRCIAQLW